jgi:hypothetical protein
MPRHIQSRDSSGAPDSRHLLLLTRHSGVRTLAYLESGEEVYLVFDTARWHGELGPDFKEIQDLDFPVS